MDNQLYHKSFQAVGWTYSIFEPRIIVFNERDRKCLYSYVVLPQPTKKHLFPALEAATNPTGK